METLMSDMQIKNLFKTAIVEVMEERRDIFREAIEEVLEDIALSRAIDEAEDSDMVSEEEIFEFLRSAA